MSDLISREKAIAKIENAMCEDGFRSGTGLVHKAKVYEIILSLPDAQPNEDKRELTRAITAGIITTNTKDVYSCGMRNGMRWCRALVDDKSPEFEDASQYVLMSKHKRLIDADDLKEKVEKIHPWEPYPSKYAEGIRHCMEVTIAIINEQPTIEAEKHVIHCKDCKHFGKHRCMDSMPTQWCDLNQTFYDPECDYCSLAERREDETN